MNRIEPLAPIHSIVYTSPDPAHIFTYTPGIEVLPSGRLIATMDMGGPGTRDLEGPKVIVPSSKDLVQGRVYISDDGGDSWRFTAYFPFIHARPFWAGNRLYLLGHADDLMISVSYDEGETWKEPSKLTEGEYWSCGACNVYHEKGKIYLSNERIKKVDHEKWFWQISNCAPVLMRADESSNLTCRENWTFSEDMVFYDHVDWDKSEYFGIPFYPERRFEMYRVGDKRAAAPCGWLESNVIRITDPDHIWYDNEGKTLHLFLRAPTGHTNFCALIQMKEMDNGTIRPDFVNAPSGKKWLYTPFPGGQMRFHILQDHITKLYWLISSQSQDSMIKPERMPANRYSLPDNERHRLQLHFSKNCIDWCFAGLIDCGATALESRHYACAAIRGDDLLVLSRSGDSHAHSAHNGNMITFHVVKNFRELVY